MDFTFTTMATPGVEISKIIEEGINYGFSGIDFRVVTPRGGEIDVNISDDAIEEIKNLMGDKIYISSLFCYNKTIHAGEEEMIESVIKHMELAERLSVKNIRIFPGKAENNEVLDKICYVLNKVFEKCDKKVNVLLQNHLNNGITSVQALYIKRKVSDNRYGFIFSPDEAVKGGEDYMNTLEDICKITRQVFIADLDNDMKYTLIGKGKINFKCILTKMIEYGYTGLVTLKWEKCWCDYLPSYKEGFSSFLKLKEFLEK